MRTPSNTPQVPTGGAPVAQPDIQVAILAGMPVPVLSPKYRPRDGEQMARDILRTFQEHVPGSVHPDVVIPGE